MIILRCGLTWQPGRACQVGPYWRKEIRMTTVQDEQIPMAMTIDCEICQEFMGWALTDQWSQARSIALTIHLTDHRLVEEPI